MENRFTVTLDGDGIGRDGVPVGDFFEAVNGVQDAIAVMVQHLGGREVGPGQRPKWVRDQSRVWLKAIHHSSFVAELELKPPPDDQPYLEQFGRQALESMLSWDGTEPSSLPQAVTNRLLDIPDSLPNGVQVWYGTTHEPRKVEIKRNVRTKKAKADDTEALLSGWLKEVNWHLGTAQLHRHGSEYVRLNFYESLADDMLRLATQYVEVRGRGSIDERDRWGSVKVDEISGTRSGGEPFDMDEFLNNPNPKIFDPEKVVTASEPFDVDEFVRIIHEGRETRPEDYS